MSYMAEFFFKIQLVYICRNRLSWHPSGHEGCHPSLLRIEGIVTETLKWMRPLQAVRECREAGSVFHDVSTALIQTEKILSCDLVALALMVCT